MTNIDRWKQRENGEFTSKSKALRTVMLMRIGLRWMHYGTKSSSSVSEFLVSLKNNSDYKDEPTFNTICGFLDTKHNEIGINIDALWAILLQWEIEHLSQDDSLDIHCIQNVKSSLETIDEATINLVRKCLDEWIIS